MVITKNYYNPSQQNHKNHAIVLLKKIAQWKHQVFKYQGTIKCSNSKYKQKIYKGICEVTFKKRYTNHKKSFSLIMSKNDTSPEIYGKSKDSNPTYNPTLEKNVTFA